MISTIQNCFRVLARLGLQVQHRKTQLLVAHKGRLAHRWWQVHTASTKDGRFLRIPQPNKKDLHLPIVPQLTYLGIILSYKDATTATVEHRLQVAEAQRARLLKVLHSRTLPLRKRVQLWVACVRSSALYGLHLLDLQQKHVARITIVLVKHLRAIARSFAHMSQEASQTLLLRLGVEDPLPFLLRTGQKLLTKTLQSQDPMVHQPRILQWLTHITEARLALDSHVAHVIPPNVESSPAETVLDGAIQESLRIASLPNPLVGTQPGALVSGRHGPRAATFSCPTCRLCFPDLAALKKHHAKHHASPVTPPHPTADAAEIRQHSVNGMPVCKHCGKDYITWFNLKRHIQNGHCTRRWQTALAPQASPAPEFASEGQSIVQSMLQVPRSDADPLEDAPPTTAPAPGAPMPAEGPPPSGSLLSAMIPVSPTKWLHFARCPEVQATLRQFCATCGQWLVSVKSIKLHYRHIHTDIYNRFCQTAAADCRKVGHLISPCVYCGATITRTDQHSCTCPVLWQARVCCLVQADLASKRVAEPAPALNSASSSHGACAHADGLGRGGEAVLRESPGRRQTATPPHKTVVPARRPPPSKAEERRNTEENRGLLRTSCCTRWPRHSSSSRIICRASKAITRSSSHFGMATALS